MKCLATMSPVTSRTYSQVGESSHSCGKVCVGDIRSAAYIRVSSSEVFVNILGKAEVINTNRYIFENFFQIQERQLSTCAEACHLPKAILKLNALPRYQSHYWWYVNLSVKLDCFNTYPENR